MEITFVQFLSWSAAILLLLPLFSILTTLLRNARLYFSGLHKLPQPAFPSRNPLSLLLHGHGLLTAVFRADPEHSCAYFHKVFQSLRSPVFVLTGSFLSTNVFVFSPSAMRTLATSPPHSLSRPRVIRFFIRSLTGDDSIFVSEGPRHRRLRGALSAALAHDNLARLGPHFVTRGEALARELANAPDPDPLLGIRRATCHIIISACFGQHAVSEDRIERIMFLYHHALTDQKGFAVLLLLMHVGLPFTPITWAFFGERCKFKVRREVRQLCLEFLTRCAPTDADRTHEKASGDVTSLLSIMCAACDDGKLSVDDLVQTVLSFLVAGQATTTIGTAWAFYLLARNERWQARVHEEIRDNWARGDALHALDRLPLLDRAVRETLRLYPPIQNTVRTVEADMTVDGFRIPAGSHVRVPFAAIQRREDFWGSNANEFNPDRFLKLDAHPDAKWMWPTFWFGSHGCVGQRFALLEIKAFVATMLLRYRLSVNEPRDGKPFRKGTEQTPKNLRLYYDPR